jgi:hypothetical protein
MYLYFTTQIGKQSLTGTPQLVASRLVAAGWWRPVGGEPVGGRPFGGGRLVANP